MRILVGGIEQETNMFSPERVSYSDFRQYRGQDLIKTVPSLNKITENGHELITSVRAVITPSGPLSSEEFMLFVDEFIGAVPEGETVDGIYVSLHGAMFVSDIGSGEEYLLSRLRHRFGSEIPISASFDFHGNLTPGIASLLNYATAYRTAPHVDEEETRARAISALISILEQGILPRVSVVNIPLLLPGEMVITEDYPSNEIIRRLASIEQQPNVLDVSFVCGFVWADNSYMAMSIAYTYKEPDTYLDKAIAEEAKYIWSLRDKFGFSVEALEPKDAVLKAVEDQKRPVFISDSGDNITAGAAGDSVFMLNLALENGIKKALIGGIADAEFCESHKNSLIGSRITAKLGGTIDPASGSIEFEAVIKAKNFMKAPFKSYYFLLEAEGLDILVTSARCAFTSPQEYAAAEIDIFDYDTIFIKLGYLYPLLAPVAARSILALSPGNAYQKTQCIKYKNGGRFYPAFDVSYP